VEEHLQHIAWAWNTTVHATTGLRPFEICTGASPVTLADALILPPPNTSNINIHDIRVSAVAYAKASCEHADYMYSRRDEVLNTHGRVLKALKVGDHVKIFIPPSHSEAVRRRRKAKHICQWRGPLQIKSKLSNTIFELSLFFNPFKTFRRHLSNVRRWRGPLPSASVDDDGILPLVLDMEVGEFAFVRDTPSAKVYTLLKLLVLMTIL
jgi:hypothetical protein